MIFRSEVEIFETRKVSLLKTILGARTTGPGKFSGQQTNQLQVQKVREPPNNIVNQEKEEVSCEDMPFYKGQLVYQIHFQASRLASGWLLLKRYFFHMHSALVLRPCHIQ